MRPENVLIFILTYLINNVVGIGRSERRLCNRRECGTLQELRRDPRMSSTDLISLFSLGFIEDRIKYLLYEGNYSRAITSENMKLLNINTSTDTKFLIHGWMSNPKKEMATSIHKEYAKHTNYNVIVVDWSALADNIFYPVVAFLTQAVGKGVANFIAKFAHVLNANYSSIHIIGHSLGAHVASVAGKVLKGNLGRITSLDPAAPCFQKPGLCTILDPLAGISKRDARFVDVIHTTVGILGLPDPMGHADFYPNGGNPVQPGCLNWLYPFHSIKCSHERAYVYFAESIGKPYNFQAVSCTYWFLYVVFDCKPESVIMGEATPHDVRGRYFLNTYFEAPYGLGERGTKIDILPFK